MEDNVSAPTPDLAAFTLYKFECIINKFFGSIFRTRGINTTWSDSLNFYSYSSDLITKSDGRCYYQMVFIYRTVSTISDTISNQIVKTPLTIGLYYKHMLIYD